MLQTEQVFVLIDNARINSDPARFDIGHELIGSSLYEGKSKEFLENFAPYLLSLEGGSAQCISLVEKLWSHGAAIFFKSDSTSDDLHRHFRKFLFVKTSKGKELYFRFYDPRVLRIFLPTCDQKQLLDFFEPIKYFITEDKDSDFGIQWWLENGGLKTRRFERNELFKRAGVNSSKEKWESSSPSSTGGYNVWID